MPIPYLFFGVPFLHIGFTFWLSVLTLMGLLVFWRLHMRDPLVECRHLLRVRLFTSLLILVLVFCGPQFTRGDISSAIRDAIFFFLITGSLYSSALFSPSEVRLADRILALITALMLGLLCLQMAFLAKGYYFGLPKSWFSTNYATLPSELSLMFSKVRPAGTFGEPSYLSFVFVGVIYAMAARSLEEIIRKPLFWMCVVCIAISRSMVGLFGGILIIFSIVLNGPDRKRGLIALLFFFVAVVLPYLLFSSTISTRLVQIANASDGSTAIRFILPMYYLSQTFLSEPFGQSLTTLLSMNVVPEIGMPGSVLADNVIFVLMIEYGLIGILVLLVTFLSARDGPTRMLLFVAMMQNGGLYGFDKYALLALFVGLYNARLRDRAMRDPPAGIILKKPIFGVSRLGSIFLVGFLALAASGSRALAVDCASVCVQTSTGEKTFSSLPIALEYIRTQRLSGDRGRIGLAFSAGVWRLTQPLIIDATLAGADTQGLDIIGAGIGKTVFSGAEVGAPTMTAGNTADIKTLTLPHQIALDPFDIEHDYGILSFQLFQGDRMLRLSRWPQDGMTHGELRMKETGMLTPVDSSVNCPAETSVFLGGYWSADWAFEFVKGTSAPDGKSFRLGPFVYSNHPRSSVRFFVANCLNHFTQAGTYVLQSDGQTVLVRPIPGMGPVEIGKAHLLLQLDHVRHVQISNLSVVKSLGDGIVIRNSSDIHVSDVTVAAVGHTGILIESGDHVVLRRVNVRDTGATGIYVYGGDRPSLIGAGHVVADSRIEGFASIARDYRAAIRLEGVGLMAQDNFIRSGGASGIILSGNENVVRGNEISDVLPDSDDAGAIYMGRDWTARGNLVEGNFIHDVGYGRGRNFVVGIYLDDQISGETVERNVIWDVPVGIVLGGGRDNILRNNLIFRPERGAISVDERGKTVRFSAGQATLKQKFSAMPVGSPVWRSRYPQLADLLQNDPSAADGNVVSGNRAIDGPLWFPATPENFWQDGNTALSVSSNALAKTRICLNRPAECGSADWFGAAALAK